MGPVMARNTPSLGTILNAPSHHQAQPQLDMEISVSAPEQASSPFSEQREDAHISNTDLSLHNYHEIFHSCPVGMAIASLGGTFVDCNTLFCDMSGYTKEEICALTIFNLTDQNELQHAFDSISQMLPSSSSSSSPSAQSSITTDPGDEPVRYCTLRGSFKDRTDLGLCVSLTNGDGGVAKCFCITLVNAPPQA